MLREEDEQKKRNIFTGAMQNSTTSTSKNEAITSTTTATSTICSSSAYNPSRSSYLNNSNVGGKVKSATCSSNNNDSNFNGGGDDGCERGGNVAASAAATFEERSAARSNRSNSILSSKYLILSPSNPLRIFAISFLTSWIYYAVISVTVCAFVTSSIYCASSYPNFMQINCGGSSANSNSYDDCGEERNNKGEIILALSRWALFITLSTEILVKSFARGFFVGSKFAFLRIAWDWVDVASLIFVFLSIINPTKKTTEFIAAAVVLLKLIPIHTGSINAFIFLCTCAKKLIPVLFYGVIIVWIYGFLIFTLFVKYHDDHHQPQPPQHEDLTKWPFSSVTAGVIQSNESSTNNNTSNVINNGSPSSPSSYLPTPSTGLVMITTLQEQQNFSHGLSMGCLPTNFRSLSGSFIQTVEMLTLRYFQRETLSLKNVTLSGTEKNGENGEEEDEEKNLLRNLHSNSCQYEINTLSIIETLVILSGTLPMLIMSFAIITHLFQKITKSNQQSKENNVEQQHTNQNETENANEPEMDFYIRQSEISQSQPAPPQPSIRKESFLNKIGSSFCYCDYYFCCLANLQRRCSPLTSGLLNSKKFKAFVVLILSTDFLCMAILHLPWFPPTATTTAAEETVVEEAITASNKSTVTNTAEDIDFPSGFPFPPLLLLIIRYYAQLCFVLYTVEALVRWISVSSDEYWMTIWPAFDLTLVVVYWILFGLLHVVFNSGNQQQSYYLILCGISTVRMLKIVPYWKSLEHTLNLLVLSVLRNRFNLLVIMICSCSCFLLKYTVYLLEGEWGSQKPQPQLSSRDLNLHPPSLLSTDFYTFSDSLFYLILFFFCSVIVITLECHMFDLFKNPPEKSLTSAAKTVSTRNPSITVFLSNCSNNPSPDDITFDELRRPSEQHLLSSSSRSFAESSSPISVMSVPNGIPHHLNLNKYRFASSPSASSNGGLLSPADTRSSILSPSSDVLSPLLSLPVPNGGINGHGPHHHNHLLQPSPTSSAAHYLDDNEESIRFGRSSCNSSSARRDSYLDMYRRASIEDLTNLISSLLVILASVNMLLAVNEEMSWKSISFGKTLWIELFFVMGVAAHIVFKTKLSRFARDTFIQIASVADLIVILCAAIEIFSSGMGWFPTTDENESIYVFLKCAKVVSALRGLLLLSRVPWLQCVGSGLCYTIWKAFKNITAIIYLWAIFIISSVATQNMIDEIVKGLSETKNETSTEKDFIETGNYTNLEEKEKSLVTPPTPTTVPSPPQSKNDMREVDDIFLHPILITVMIILFLLSLAAILGFLRHQLGNLSQFTQKFMTKSQATCQRKRTDCSSSFSSAFPCQLSFMEYPELLLPSSSGGAQAAKPTKGICVPILYFVANHRTFDVIVMAVIFFDALGITFEYFATSERAVILRIHYPAYMLFLYGMEISFKLVGNGWHFFKSYWNLFDCITIIVCTVDFCVTLFSQTWVPLLIQNLRFFRILRIFQFYPFTSRAEIIPQFFQTLIPNSTLFYPLLNFSLFYFFLHLAFLSFNIRTNSSFSSSSWPILAPPLESINPSMILQNGLNSYSFDRVFYALGQILFSLTKLSVAFIVCFIFVYFLSQYLLEHDKENVSDTTGKISRSRSHSFHNVGQVGGDEEDDDGHLDFEDKVSFMMPCLSLSETIEIETPSSSAGGTSSKLIAGGCPSNSTGTLKCQQNITDNDNNVSGEPKPNNLYKTTTITSSEEINGCKVFFVEAMITTV